MQLDYKIKIDEAISELQSGNLEASKKILGELSLQNSNNYCTIINSGVVCIQEGKLEEAKRLFQKAIKIDCYQYLGYYNLFIVLCHQRQANKNYQPNGEKFSQKQGKEQKEEILGVLFLALSCLFAELGQIQGDIKMCGKSLAYCEENAIAYMIRAALYQRDQKPQLAQNDYSSSIYYDPQNPIFYMKRAQHYWKNGNTAQSNGDIKMYFLKKCSQYTDAPMSALAYTFSSNPSSCDPTPKKHTLKPKQITESDLQQFDSLLYTKCVELNDLLTKVSLANKKKENDWQVRIPASPNSHKTGIFFQKFSNDVKNGEKFGLSNTGDRYFKAQPQDKIESKQELLLSSEKSLQRHQSQKNSQPYVDQSSKNISQQIQKLQKQIRQERNKLGQSSQQSQSQPQPQQQTFLTAQIQKTSKQIQTLKTSQPSPRPRLSLSIPQNPLIASLQSRSNSSIQSRQSQIYIPVVQLKKYTKVLLQVVSAQYFDNSSKYECKVYLTYGSQKKQTQYSKTNIWREKMEFQIQYHLHKDFKSALDSSGDIDAEEFGRSSDGDIQIQLEVKSKSIWSTKKILGKGAINIQRQGDNKCILSNQKEKTGIVYFKMKLQ